MRGTPQWPYMSSQLAAKLTRFALTTAKVMGRTMFMAWR